MPPAWWVGPELLKRKLNPANTDLSCTEWWSSEGSKHPQMFTLGSVLKFGEMYRSRSLFTFICFFQVSQVNAHIIWMYESLKYIFKSVNAHVERNNGKQCILAQTMRFDPMTCHLGFLLWWKHVGSTTRHFLKTLMFGSVLCGLPTWTFCYISLYRIHAQWLPVAHKS